VSRLPTRLADWRRPLSQLRPEYQYPVARMAQRLALAIGPLRAMAEPGDGEPDGFDGLSRRGPYDRLLTSEWLLADEAPAEFLRRAAMREHAFLALARKEPRSVKSCAVLVDGGPDQLGAPRIAQLAALICLGARADAVDAELRWGLLQDPETRIFGPIEPANVTSFLNSRAARDPTPDDLARWSWLLESDPLPDMTYWLGGSVLAELVDRRPGGRVVFDEPLELETRSIRARVRHSPGATSTLQLERPPSPVEEALLSDPFGRPFNAPAPRKQTNAPHLRVRPDQPLLFTPSGRRLFVATESIGQPTWVGCSLRSSSGHKIRRDREVRPATQGHVIGLGWSSKSLLTMVAEDETAVLAGEYGRDPAASKREVFELPDILKGAQSTGVIARFKTPPYTALAVNGRLLLGGNRLGGWPHTAKVLAQLVRPGNAVYVLREEAKLPAITWSRFGHQEHHTPPQLDDAQGGEAFVLGPPSPDGPQHAAAFQLAWRERGLPTVHIQCAQFQGDAASVVLRTGEELVGVLGLRAYPWLPAVLVLIDGRLLLRFPESTQRDPIPVPCEGRVIRSAVSSNEPVIAWLSSEGELAAWNAADNVMVLQREVTLVVEPNREAP